MGPRVSDSQHSALRTRHWPEVLITGVGVVSPLGLSPSELAARFCAGESAVGPLDDLGIHGAFGAVVGEIPLQAVAADKRARVGRLDRLCRLFLSAAYLAVESAGLEFAEAEADRVGLSFGTGLGCLLTNAEYNQKLVEHGPSAASPRLFAYTVSSAAAGEVSIALGIKGANVTSHAGLAAGLQAIGYGFDLIRMGKADVVLAGGADALGEALVRGLGDMGLLRTRAGALPFADRVPGVYPAEGAAVVVLERHDRALRRGARCWARIDGYAAGFEPTLTHHARQCTGIVETMRRALASSGRGPGDVDLILTSAHATAVDDTERAALRAIFAGAGAPVILAPKTAWGETFGADGALSVALASALLREPQALADSVAFDLNGTALGARDASAGVQRAKLALVHSLCYSGPTVTLVLAREE